MTTITELAKLIERQSPSLDGPLDPDRARRIAERVARAAGDAFDGRAFTVESLHEIFALAVGGSAEAERRLGGRHLRSRVSAAYRRATELGESFGIVALTLDAMVDAPKVSRLADVLEPNLRRRDQIFVLRRHLVLLFADVPLGVVGSLSARAVGALARAGYPAERVAAQSLEVRGGTTMQRLEVLDWVEDRLR